MPTQTMNDSATALDLGPVCADCAKPFRACLCERYPKRDAGIAVKVKVDERQALALEGILTELQAIRAAMGKRS